ncbi:MAG: hypothetical protein QOH17_3207, partial [Pseudonocardiales bacterium]|nr:hypothetical protein [Pseudonocardiales bacterium]
MRGRVSPRLSCFERFARRDRKHLLQRRAIAASNPSASRTYRYTVEVPTPNPRARSAYVSPLRKWAITSRAWRLDSVIALYVIYNIAATVTSFPAGGLSDKLGLRGTLLVTAA